VKNEKAKRAPNFFIVGAPKCGTTSMYEYLRQHPDVFMPYDKDRFWKAKEPHFYASDLDIKDRVRINNLDEYTELFQHAKNESRIGESSALYLYSTAAVEQICQLALDTDSDIKIVIMLRPPVEMIQSWHRDCIRWGHEDIVSLQKAVEAEPDRKKGKRIPKYSEYPSMLLYSEMGKYLRHVQQYINSFGSDNVHIILLEDLDLEPKATYQALLEFLGVDSTFVPDFEIHNQASKMDANDVGVQQLKMFLLNNTRFVYPLFKKLSTSQQQFIRSLPKYLLPKKNKESTNQRFIEKLGTSYKSEVEQLGKILNRDLTHWQNQVLSEK